jgi:glycosyltransferase involved in cell wall biosynthesis
MIIGIDASRAFAEQRTGTENYSYYLIRELVRLDRKNRYILYSKKEIKDRAFQEKNVRIKPIGLPRLWTQVGLAWQTWKDKLDILFVPAHTLPVLRKPGLKTVVTIHGVEYQFLPQYYQFPQKLYLNWSTRYAVNSATKIIAVSDFTKKELIKWLGAMEGKITVIHEGVDIYEYVNDDIDIINSSVMARYGIKKPYILFTGVIQPRKNLVRLIQAFAKLKGSGPLPVQLVIVGRRGWMDEEVFEAARKSGVKDLIKFLGFVPQTDLLPIFRAASLYVQPSLTEGFGLPVLEAMAAGVPVAAAKAGALPEVVGEAGLLFEPTSIAQIARSMKEILTNKKMADELRKKGYNRVKHFSWEMAARKTLELLEKVVKQG